MPDELPFERVYAYAESVYQRLQVEDVLTRCMEEGNLEPLERLVETVLLEGPKCLGLLHELSTETNLRKIQVSHDLQQIWSGFLKNLDSFGVQPQNLKIEGISHLRSSRFLRLLRKAGITEEEDQIVCFQMLRDTRELVDSLQMHLHLLEEMEMYVRDWLMGMYCQYIRFDSNKNPAPHKEWIL